MNEQEIIADIIAEMRTLSNPISDGIIAINGRIIADRLEAAHRREVATTKESLAVGNRGERAKLREAALRQKELLQTIYSRGSVDRRELCAGMGLIDAALAAPPRNCDRPECKDIQSAMNVYRRECCEDGPLYARKEGAMHEAEWLLAPATEKEGGNDGNE